jgi:hypothetical protein
VLLGFPLIAEKSSTRSGARAARWARSGRRALIGLVVIGAGSAKVRSRLTAAVKTKVTLIESTRWAGIASIPGVPSKALLKTAKILANKIRKWHQTRLGRV